MAGYRAGTPSQCAPRVPSHGETAMILPPSASTLEVGYRLACR